MKYVVSFIGSIVLFMSLLGYILYHKVQDSQAVCDSRGMEMVGGGHAPLMCHDPATGQLYLARKVK